MAIHFIQIQSMKTPNLNFNLTRIKMNQFLSRYISDKLNFNNEDNCLDAKGAI